MEMFIGRWAETVIANRLSVIIGTVILMGMGFFFGQGIPFNNTNERFFLKGDPNLESFQKLVDLFGDTEYLVVGIEAREQDRDVFESETVQLIHSITEFLDRHEYVTQVRSLSRYQITRNDGSALSTDDLFEDIDELSTRPEVLDSARTTMRGESLALGTLLTEDFQHTRIAARVEYRYDTAEHKVELVLALYHFLETEKLTELGYNFHFSGQPLINEQFETLTKSDTKVLNPLMALVMMLVLYSSFRSVTATLLPWVVIGAGILCVQGIQGLLGYPHSPVDSALIPTMIIIGIGVSVHVLVEFYNHRRDGLSPVDSARESVVELWMPAFYTAVTTSVGFYALSVTKIVPVKEFALLGAIGPLLLFLFAMTALPALLSYVRQFSERTKILVDGGVVSRLTAAVPKFTLRYRNPILFLGLGLIVFTGLSIQKIQVDSNVARYFKEKSSARVDMKYFDDTYQGMLNIDFLIDSGRDDGIKAPRFLQRVESLQTYLESLESLGSFNSLIDYLKQINQSLNEDDPAFYRLPTSSEMTAQFLLLYENSGPEEDLSDLKDFDNRFLRLPAPMINMQASAMSEELKSIRHKLDTEYRDLTVELTGSGVMFNAQDIYTSMGMAKSFSIALLVICLCFIALFRSLKYGILSIVPSVLPVLITGGVIGLVGINLDLGTMIVGAMTMGIAVDDAIHVMNRYLGAKKRGATTQEAIRRAMAESGRAVVFSSIVLVLGFCVLLLGSFVPVIYVGLFGASIMFLALLGDLLFLPAILYLVDAPKNTKEIGRISDSNVPVPHESSEKPDNH